MDENLLFVSLIIIFLIFIIQKQTKLILTIGLIYMAYMIYKSSFVSPRDMIEYFTNKIKESFEPCSNNNQVYCGTDTNSNMTILPDWMRSSSIINSNNKCGKAGNNGIDGIGSIGGKELNPEDYKLDRIMKCGLTEISIDTIINSIPVLLDYKYFQDKIIKFTFAIKTDDPIQKDFLARKLNHKMSAIFYNAYNTITDNRYAIQTFNQLLQSQREFNDTLDIFIFLGMDNITYDKLLTLQKEFNELNSKLNEYIREKVNNISSNDFDFTTSRLPTTDEPLPANVILD